MIYTKYQEHSFHSLMRECDKNDHINHYDRVSINDYMKDNKYILLQETDSYCPILFRLTLPFYALYVLILFLFMPIKWIFTGNGYYRYNCIIMKLYRNWSSKLKIDYI